MLFCEPIIIFLCLEADFPRSSKHPCPHHVLEESRNLKKENEALKERVSYYPCLSPIVIFGETLSINFV